MLELDVNIAFGLPTAKGLLRDTKPDGTHGYCANGRCIAAIWGVEAFNIPGQYKSERGHIWDNGIGNQFLNLFNNPKRLRELQDLNNQGYEELATRLMIEELLKTGKVTLKTTSYTVAEKQPVTA